MKCKHGCGTELPTLSVCTGTHMTYRSDYQPHTPERCQAATRTLLDEARRDLNAVSAGRDKLNGLLLEEIAKCEAAEKRAVEAEDELAELRADLGELMRCDYGPQGCMWNGNGENAVTHLRGHLEDLAKTYDSREPELMRALREQRDAATAKLAEAEQERDEFRRHWAVRDEDVKMTTWKLRAAIARAERLRAALERISTSSENHVEVQWAEDAVRVDNSALAQSADAPETSAETNEDYCCMCAAPIDVASAKYNVVCLKCEERPWRAPRRAETRRAGVESTSIATPERTEEKEE